MKEYTLNNFKSNMAEKQIMLQNSGLLVDLVTNLELILIS